VIEVREVGAADALSERLGVAVRSNWITQGQASAIADEMRQMQMRLQTSVEAGAMTREEAADEHRRAEYEAIDEAVRERVAAGALTERYGRAAVEAYVSLGSGRGGA
jgi:hypothetical protein